MRVRTRIINLCECGRPKPAGKGRKLCTDCAESRQSIVYAAKVQRQVEASRRRRHAEIEAHPVLKYRQTMADAPEGHKWCNDCNEYRPDRIFPPAGYRCKDCASDRAHENFIKAKYNLSVEDYQRLLEIQDFRCAICRRAWKAQRPAVDHDHRTGTVRGLLCFRCNHKLLGAANEQPLMLRRAARYLEAPPATTGRLDRDTAEVTTMMISDQLKDAGRRADVQGVTRYAVINPHPEADEPAEAVVSMPFWLFLELISDVERQESAA